MKTYITTDMNAPTSFLLFSLILFCFSCSVDRNSNDSGDSVTNSQESNRQSIITDSRDGQSYKVVRLKDNRLWFAENLNYDHPDSYCFSCNDFGRLYNFSVLNEVCPDGWNVPTLQEWWNMLELYEPEHLTYDSPNKISFNGDGNNPILNGENGFNAQLGGRYLTSIESIDNQDDFGYYWANTQLGRKKGYEIVFSTISEDIWKDDRKISSQYIACRCIQNEESE